MQVDGKTIKGILFDVDDTLYAQKYSFIRACVDTFGEDCLGLSVDDLFEAYYKVYDKRSARLDAGENAMEGMAQLHRKRIKAAMASLGVPITEEQMVTFQEHYLYNQSHLQLSERMIRMLGNLSASYRLGVISNGAADYQRQKIDGLALTRFIREEAIIISGEVGLDKPDVGIFRLAQEKLGLDPKELVFVGDSLYNDIGGANQAGWTSVWINRRDQIRTDEDAVPDFEVKTEKELAELLEA